MYTKIANHNARLPPHKRQQPLFYIVANKGNPSLAAIIGDFKKA